MNIFVLLFKFNYQTCLSQLASGNFNWNIPVTMLKLGYICNFGLISQYLTFTSDLRFLVEISVKSSFTQSTVRAFYVDMTEFFSFT